MRGGNNSLEATFNVTPEDVAAQMAPEEIPEDVTALINQIVALCA